LFVKKSWKIWGWLGARVMRSSNLKKTSCNNSWLDERCRKDASFPDVEKEEGRSRGQACKGF